MHVSAKEQVYPLLNTVLNTYSSCKETKNAIIKKIIPATVIILHLLKEYSVICVVSYAKSNSHAMR